MSTHEQSSAGDWKQHQRPRAPAAEDRAITETDEPVHRLDYQPLEEVLRSYNTAQSKCSIIRKTPKGTQLKLNGEIKSISTVKSKSVHLKSSGLTILQTSSESIVLLKWFSVELKCLSKLIDLKIILNITMDIVTNKKM